MSEPVYVTGIGCVLPGATGEAQLKAVLGRSDSLARPSTLGCDSKAASIGEFDPSPWIRPIARRRMNRIGILATAGAHLALESAGIDIAELVPETTGIALGTGLGCTQSIDDFFRQMMIDGRALANPAIYPTSVPNAIASQVALNLKIGGPNVTVSQREVSGEAALLLGVDWIRSGRAKRVLVGGADELSPLLPQHLTGLGQVAGARDPSCPFDRLSAGAAVGEGVTFLLLEGREGKPRTRARVTAGALLGSPVPADTVDRSGLALYQCIEEVGSRIDLVVCGASGYRDLDLAHAQALRKLPGGSEPLITAPKSIFGESLSCGVLAAAIAVIALSQGTAPGIAGLGEALDECDGLHLLRAPRTDLAISTALVAGSASGGAAAAVVLQS